MKERGPQRAAPASVPADASPSAGPLAPAPGTARALYTDILRFGPRPRTELAARLDVSGPTITRLTRGLLDDGLLRELPPVPQQKGRPQEPLEIVADHARFIGVKVAADEVHAVVTDPRANVLEELVAPLPSRAPAVVTRVIRDLVRPLARAHPRVAGVGVSLGGWVADRRRLIACPMLGWDGPVELAEGLEARLGLPVAIENDMTSLLQGVLWFGVGRRWDSFLLLTIGQGVGVGVVERGRAVEGRRHMAGQAATLPTTTRAGRPVELGEVACTAGMLTAARETGVLGEDDGLPALLAAVRAGEPGAIRVADEVTHELAVAAAGLVGVLDLGAVLLGGEAVEMVCGAHGSGRAVEEGSFDEVLRSRLIPGQRDVAVRRISQDFDEWARGAAVIAIQEFLGGL